MIEALHILGQTVPTPTTVASGCSLGTYGLKVNGLCTTPGSLRIPVAYRTIIPLLVVTIGALLMLTLSAVLPKRSRPGLWPGLTALIGAASLAGSVWQWYDLGGKGAAQPAIGGQIFYDRFSALFLILISIAVIFGALTADSYLRREELDGIEAYVLMLMSATGAMLMAEAGSLIMLFLGLEIMSIALYVMAAYHRRRTQSGEAGLKYFVLGSFSSAIFLYGVALIYGATGSVEFGSIGTFLTGNVLANNGVLLGGMALVIVGLGFKVAGVPFHYWTPDVYQGSPTPFTGYMAAVAKAAGFAGLFRVLTEALNTQQTNWRPAIWLMAVLTLIVGSVMAIAQKDLKRMMAYSSISQAGYVLVGLQAASANGTSGALFYLFTYTFIIVGTFAVIGVLQGPGEARNDLGVIQGLARRQPVLAGLMLVFLLAQAGVPFTSGFLAKFYVIQASVQRGQYWLAIIAMLAAAVAAFFYLRVALLMYGGSDSASESVAPAPTSAALVPSGAESPAAELDVFSAGLQPIAAFDEEAVLTIEEPPPGRAPIPFAVGAVLVLCAAFTIAAGVSSFALDFAKQAALLF